MSYTQFGYSSYAASSPFVIGAAGQTATPQSSCYERSGVTPDTQPSATVCSLPAAAYDSRLLSSYPRLATGLTGSTTGLYGAAAYQAADQAAYPNLGGVETSPFYPSLNSAYGMKENGDPWRGISQSASYYYDPTLAAYGYGGLDFNGARRKNVTRDSTSTLKAWLNEHRKNPYPTKGEKIMLAIITKMTLTQVSTWFANARRRLKKENKMTWEPRNKTDQDDEKKDATGDDEDDGTDGEDGGKSDGGGNGQGRCHGNQQDSSRFVNVDAVGDCGGQGAMRNGLVTNGDVSGGRDPLANGLSSEADLPHLRHHPCHPTAPGSNNKISENDPGSYGTALTDVVTLGVSGGGGSHGCADEPHQSSVSSLQCSATGSTATAGACFTPSVSSHSSSPDLSSIDSYISSPSAVVGVTTASADNKDVVAASLAMSGAASSAAVTLASAGVPPSSGYDGGRNGDSLLAGGGHNKPKIWSLADTATNKAAGTSLLVGTNVAYAGSELGSDLSSPSGWLTTSGGGGGPGTAGGSGVSNFGGSFHSFGANVATMSSAAAPYSCSIHGFNPVSLQTDTPPQTPPNMKVTSALSLHHVTAAVPSPYLEGQSHLYLGQSASSRGCGGSIHISQMQVDKHCGNFSTNHVTSLPQSSSSNQRAECIREEYSGHAQYREPPVH